MQQKEHFEEQKILSSNERRRRDLVETVGHKKTWEEGNQRDSRQEMSPMGRSSKSKSESKSNLTTNKEEESLDNDDNKEEEEQVAQPAAQVEWPAYVAPRPYVPPRPDYILMDYDKSMGDVVIPDNKVIRPMNPWCYMNLDPVHWRENSIDRCPNYGVC
jgi:hypothetical protein